MSDESTNPTDDTAQYLPTSDAASPEVTPDEAQFAVEIEGRLAATLIANLRGVMDPSNDHLRQPGVEPEHIAAYIATEIQDTFDGDTPDYIHLGWRQHVREAFRTLIARGVDPGFDITSWWFDATELEHDDDLDEFDDDIQQKAWWIMRENLAKPGYNRYVDLTIAKAIVVRLPGTDDGTAHLDHFNSLDGADRTETVVIDLDEEVISDLIRLNQIPGVGTAVMAPARRQATKTTREFLAEFLAETDGFSSRADADGAEQTDPGADSGGNDTAFPEAVSSSGDAGDVDDAEIEAFFEQAASSTGPSRDGHAADPTPVSPDESS